MKSFIFCLILIILGIFIYALVLKGIWGNIPSSALKENTEFSLRDRGRYVLTENLIANRSFALNREQADLAAPDAGYFKGKWYEVYPPGMSIIVIPFYLIGYQYSLSLVASFAMGGIFAILILVLIFLISRQIFKLPYWACFLASLIFGFTSISLGYATTLFQHHVTTFLILLAFYSAFQYKIHKRWGFLWGFLVWFSYGAGLFFDYPNGFLMLPIMVYFLAVSLKFTKEEDKYRIKLRLAIVFTSIFFAISIFLNGYYNYINFGSWTKFSTSLPGYRNGVGKILDESKDPKTADQRIKKLSSKKSTFKFFQEDRVANGFYELLVAPDRGLFIFNPIYILVIFGIFAVMKNLDIEKITLIATPALILLFYASWNDPYGGWAFGPRYLIPAMPFLAIIVAYFIATNSHKILVRMTAFLLIIFSVGISVLGAITTNATPPKSEAVWLNKQFNTGAQYGIEYAYDFLTKGKTSDFLYTYFFYNKISLIDYYLIIFGIIMWVVYIVMFIMPVFAKPLHRETERGDFRDLSIP